MQQDNAPIHPIGMTTPELESLAESLGQPRFRGKQIAAWIYKRNARDISQMTDLPAAFRETLAQRSVIAHPTVVSSDQALDGTAKFLLELEDRQRIEAVLLPYEGRISACVSSQVGCAVRCSFCATGMGGLCRNMTAGEIVDEVLTIQRETSCRISNVVYMGMGEPLLNYENVMKSIHLLNDEVGISMRHITISTVGVTPRIMRLAREKTQLTLAVSLHAPTDIVRKKIVPLAARYPMRGLMEACKRYTDSTRRRITFEYVMIKDVNDSKLMARQLAELLHGMLCAVNLIPYNPVEGLALDRSAPDQIRMFRTILEQAGITVTQRMERGSEVSAACGQLRRRTK